MSAVRQLFARPLLPGERSLPLLVQAPSPGLNLIEALAPIRELVDHHLLTAGGLLFRGFDVGGAEAFRTFAGGFGHPLLNYEFGSTPRSNVTQGVYTSTEYPPHQKLSLIHISEPTRREWLSRMPSSA